MNLDAARKQLSSLLVADKIVDLATMEQALRRRDEMGGRLGTNLLELGAVDSDTLQAYLSAAHNVPSPTQPMLEQIDSAMARLVSVEDVVKFGAIPIATVADGVAILVKEPLEADAHKSFESLCGQALIQHILPEFRFEQALNAIHGLPLSPRAKALIDRYFSPISGRGAASGYRPSTNQGVKGGNGEGSGELGLGWSQAELASYLAHCESRDSILEALLGFVGNHLPRRFVLATKGTALRGFLGRGENVPADSVREVLLDTQGCEPATAAGKGVETFRGPPADFALAGLYEKLEIPVPDELIGFAIYIGRRPAMLVDADNLTRPLPGTIEPLLLVPVTQAATALRAIVRQQKLKTTAGQHAIPSGAQQVAAEPNAGLDSGWDIPVRRPPARRDGGTTPGFTGPSMRRAQTPVVAPDTVPKKRGAPTTPHGFASRTGDNETPDSPKRIN